MAYKPLIPQPTDNLSVSQNDILNNFIQANTTMNVDHYPFDNSSPQNGIHKKVTLLNSSAPGIGNGNGVLFATLFDGNSWPVWQNALGSTLMIGGPSNASANNGYASLPGGLVIKWGKVSGLVGGTNTQVNFAPAFLNTCFVVIPQLINAGNTNNAQTISIAKGANSPNASRFFYNYTSGSSAYDDFYWIAIGH
jgi:hypothetical protein